MTASGVVLLILGWLVAMDYPYTSDTQDAIGGWLFILGGGLVLAGVLVWLWRVMP